ncbi:GNAT family N-acetyltransferase [Erwinia psidii]|uniref:GNAT family N-acetyltransferase n=2 Tax=Erwinia psidii TaxID=69224 RepID=A0A3N6S2N4_9GAMM|nr:GNAT family N-acetyltransferase [Erwinia psidii]MCX8961527.1 GNAT family N-acetyltransferase [Erwinia psidii]MCX8965005.1 GNAT family N-acetyltransferase [Erwinia psidii]RQM39898.1 GNAT family N-acetyltransferase [Erwinia psidii]
MKNIPKGIRRANTGDLKAMAFIFNETANTGMNSPVTRSVTLKEFSFYINLYQQDNLPVYVLERDGEITGWFSVNRFSWGTRACYLTGEISVYVRADCYGRGVGILLGKAALRIGRAFGLETLVAWIMASNHASQRIARYLGGEQWGFFPEIASFGKQRTSVILYGFRPTLSLK